MQLAPGARLGPYEIVAPLGAGGMGEVYRAKDPRLGREVAIKLLPSSLSNDSDRLRRFEQEAYAAGSLNHPNVVAIHDIGTHEGSPFVVSELLEGETLRDHLSRGAFSPRKALGCALQMAHGLDAAHEKGIVHRDLKPENIFLTRDGRVKILDFGLAKLTRTQESSSPHSNLPTAAGDTEPGVVLGTLGYMSPEQVRGKPADPRSDIFSFGVILYEMLSGQRAFRGESAADTMSAILLKEPPEVSKTSSQIPPALDRIVRHCLEKDPEQRFHSAHDLAFDLEAVSDVSSALPVPATAPRVHSLRFFLAAAAALAVLTAVAVLFWPRGRGIQSLAVLPLANVSRDANVDYLSDGLTDALVNSLSQLPNLTVMSRDSVRGYKGRDFSAQAAGRELKVQAVLKGRFLQHSDDLLVDAELVEVNNNSHLWGGRFHQKLSEIQGIEEEMAKQISAKLRGRLSGEEKKRLTKRYTENPEAYQLYLKGRYLWEKRTEVPIKQSIEYFNQAIEKDPGYALAYAGLADAYAVSGSYSFISPTDSIPKSRAAAERALEMDEGLAGAHATLGFALWCYDWNFPAAEDEFKRALSIDGRHSNTHHWYGLMLISLGRTDEAVAQLHRASEIDPFSGIIRANLVRAYTYGHQLDRAFEEGRKAPEAFPIAHFRIGEAWESKRTQAQAAAEYQRAGDLLGNNAQGLLYAGLAQAVRGDRLEAKRTIDEMKALATRRYVAPVYIAYIYVALGDKPQALEWLEKAYTDHSWDLAFAKVIPRLDGLRSEPRFIDLMRRLHFAS